MSKRLIPLLVLAVLVMTAPAAMATHCERCKPLNHTCVAATAIPGWDLCYWDDFEGCVLGTECEPHAAALSLSLASEYTVASVERLDEPATPAAQTRIASIDVKKEPAR